IYCRPACPALLPGRENVVFTTPCPQRRQATGPASDAGPTRCLPCMSRRR
ncbi:MAG TPA: hypothetical protein DCF78_16885, partial [Dehalococcoidia bacterium]|nr:hypothetical protein [Dehalococcoidia bacterium]